MNRSLGAIAFEALLERAAGTLLLLVDDRLRVLQAGPDVASLAERSIDELPGMSLIAALGSVEVDHLARDALARSAPASGEAELGRRTFAIEAVPADASGLVIALHEVTALRRAERVRRDFVANISHELRTPLASIKLLAETLSSGAVADEESARDFAAQIEREIDHLAQLTDELLELARIESGEVTLVLRPVSPSSILERLAERIGPVADRRRIRIRVLEPPAEEPDRQAMADAERLGQALLNLAHNAVKYSHPGGEVRLGWRAAPAGVRLEVSDDGVGVAATHQARIFERFYKVDRSRSRDEDDGGAGRASAGLGLAIVRHIAEAHGGSAGVESEEGRGSTFWIQVPSAG